MILKKFNPSPAHPFSHIGMGISNVMFLVGVSSQVIQFGRHPLRRTEVSPLVIGDGARFNVSVRSDPTVEGGTLYRRIAGCPCTRWEST